MDQYGTFLEGAGPRAEHTSEGSKPRHSRAYLAGVSALVLCFAFYSFHRRTEAADSPVGTLDPLKVSSTLQTTLDSSEVPPNIFFVLVDDMGYNDVGFQSTDLAYATPTLDRLANNGIILTNYYTSPSCTPARAALMTGMYPHNVGMGCDGVGSFLINSKYGLPTGFQLLPEVLKARGYETHMVGKWNLGHYSESYLPHQRGFDTFLGYNGDQETYYTHHAFGVSPAYNTTFCDLMYAETTTGVGEHDCFSGNYSTDIYTQRLLAVLDDRLSSSSPLFLYMASQAVHAPLEEPPEMSYSSLQQSMLDSMQNSSGSWQRRATYARMLMSLDDGVRQIMEKLDSLHQLEHTIVVVASDNGACPGEGGSNYPLRGTKFSQFEGGVRVPALVYSLNLSSSVRGTSFGGAFHVTDWLPTLASAAGATEFIEKSLDGVNLWGTIQGADPVPSRDKIILHLDAWSYPYNSSDPAARASEVDTSSLSAAVLVNNTWKIIMGESVAKVYEPSQNCTGMSCIETGQPGLRLLFNLIDDPYESNNLAETETALVAEIESFVNETLGGIATRPAWRNPDFDAYTTWVDSSYFVVPWNSSQTER